MGEQKKIFLQSEGDQWFERNFADKPKQERERDQALTILNRLGTPFGDVLEVGCSDGWRLEELRQRFGSHCTGIEPSLKAVEAGRQRYPDIALEVGTADSLAFAAQSFDLLIAGFCLCLCDRKDLFTIAAEFDRVLRPGGTLLITEFLPPIPYRNEWAHVPGMHCYKMDYAGMFTWNPQYSLYERSVVDYHSGVAELGAYDNQISVSLLHKGPESVYPVSPYDAPG